MEKIRELVENLTEICEEKGIPVLVAFGMDKITVSEYAPDVTPELLKKARAALFTSTKSARRSMEIC